VKAKEIPLESADSSGILELLPRFELGTSSLPKEQNTDFQLKTQTKNNKSGIQSTFAGSRDTAALNIHFQNNSLQFMSKSPCNLPDNEIQ